MTKKDYELIAASFAAELRNIRAQRASLEDAIVNEADFNRAVERLEAERDSLTRVVTGLAESMKSANVRFDRAKFIGACHAQ